MRYLEVFNEIDPDRADQRSIQQRVSEPPGVTIVAPCRAFEPYAEALEAASPDFKSARGHVTLVGLWDHFGSGPPFPVTAGLRRAIEDALEAFFEHREPTTLEFDLANPPTSLQRSWNHGVIFAMATRGEAFEEMCDGARHGATIGRISPAR